MSGKIKNMIQPSSKSEDFIFNFSNMETENLKNKLTNYFKDKKIYIEVFNDNLDLSQSFMAKLKEYNAKILKCLSENLDYIIFKDGHLKTKRFASLNNIKLVNPLWIDDKITKGIFEDDSKYIVEVNYAELAYDNFSKFKTNLAKSEKKDFDFIENEEFDIKFNSYVDSKMKHIKSQKNSSSKNNSLKDYILYIY